MIGRRGRYRARRGAAGLLAAVIAALAVLTGCSTASPSPLVVGASADPVLRTAAAIYAGALSRAGVPATTRDAPVGDDAALLEAFSAGRVDLFPAFTAALQAALTPGPAPVEPVPTEPGPTEPADAAAILLSRSLPAGAAVGDPVTGEDPARGDLVPVYRSAALDKAGLKALSRVAGDLTAAQLAVLAGRVADGEDPRIVAADWLSASS